MFEFFYSQFLNIFSSTCIWMSIKNKNKDNYTFWYFWLSKGHNVWYLEIGTQQTWCRLKILREHRHAWFKYGTYDGITNSRPSYTMLTIYSISSAGDRIRDFGLTRTRKIYSDRHITEIYWNLIGFIQNNSCAFNLVTTL